MPVEEVPNDEDVRQSYNFAPGYHGLVYRANAIDHVAREDSHSEDAEDTQEKSTTDTKYKLQSMQWGRCKLLLRFIS
jgi:SOS response associated peptidase (SRAP)